MKLYTNRFVVAFVIASIFTVFAPTPGFAAAGDLDQDFGEFGTRGLIPVPGMSTRDMALLPDGKILAVGSNGPDLIIRRFQANGDIDVFFGNNGQVTIDLGSDNACGSFSFSPFSCGIAAHPDGRFVVVGEYSVGSNNDFAILSFLANGDLDASFGIGGLVTVDFDGRRDYPNDVGIQTDGKIVVVGTVAYETGFLSDADNRFGVVRLNTNGSLDTSFSSDGKLDVSFGNDSGTRNHRGNALAIQTDGKIIVAGRAIDYSLLSSDWEFGVARLNTDGSLDKSFSDDGRKRISFGDDEAAYDVKITVDGKIVVVGGASIDPNSNLGRQLAVARLNSDGSYDNSFNNNGRVLINLVADVEETLIAVDLQPDGKIVAVGHADTKIKMIRLSPEGLRDSSFSGDGIAHLINAGLARDLIIQPDGNFLFMYGDAIVRINPDLHSDSGGSVITGFSNGDDRAYGLTIQRDGKILVVGDSMQSKPEMAVARYLGNGSLDTGFGDFGMRLTSHFIHDAAGRSIATQQNGSIVVAGYGRHPGTLDFNFYVNRFKPNGDDDFVFSSDGRGRVFDFNDDYDYGAKVLIQPDDKIIVIGSSILGTDTDPNRFGIALLRLHPDGSLDTSFGSNGKVVTIVGPGPSARARNAILQSDGKIIVVGVYDLDMLVLRYNKNGTLDTSFGTNGIVRADKSGRNDIAFGLGFVYKSHIAVGGFVDSENFGALFLDPNGKFCTVCGPIGTKHYWVWVDFNHIESAYGFAVQNNGRMVMVGGESSGESGVFVTRLKRSAVAGQGFSIDTSFGSSGKTTHTSNFRSSGRATALYGNGIYIAGYRFNGHDDDFFLMKLENDSETWPDGIPFENLIFGDGFEDNN